VTEKTIIRREKNRQNPYAQISRKALQNKELSWKEKGLLAYLLSLPDDWQIYVKELPKHCKDGIKATRSALNGLKKHGHVRGMIKRDEKGRSTGYEYVVYETPMKEVKRRTKKPELSDWELEQLWVEKEEKRKEMFRESLMVGLDKQGDDYLNIAEKYGEQLNPEWH
jgi:hypothetical protein